ncbi:MAG: hypothetical protein DMG79_11170 [Acidobacteria bacterium]|nr:MAG: hypothetical protein DMG79_11170 [Acidobacteriota bacterium]
MRSLAVVFDAADAKHIFCSTRPWFKETNMRFRTSALITVLIATLAFSSLANAIATESTIYTFGESTSFWPQGGLLEDSAGNLYGTTRAGGTYGVGTVFELSPPAVSGGAWTITNLYSFVPYGSGGYVPISDLVRDQKGSFYGTYYSGGDPSCNCGGVFKLNPPAVQGGAWTEVSLYAFKQSGDGHLPTPFALALTTTGTLFGTTSRGGTWDSGVLYQLTTKNGISYTESVLYSFGDVGDGITPNGPVILDSAGALYGVTSLGGAYNQGAVFKFVPAINGQLAKESLLFSFGSSTSTGSNPSGNLIFDVGGNIYGVTNNGGTSDDGVVYSIAPGNPTWTETVLYTFTTDSGSHPIGGLTWNHTNNNLYGTTSSQNMHPAGDGTIFKLVPPATKGGVWTESTLFQFTYRVNGGFPTGAILRDSKTGTLYGTAQNGGVTSCDLFCGVIWQVTNP